jgi:hypothetical protein
MGVKFENLFKELLTYVRFVQLMLSLFLLLTALMYCLFGEEIGILLILSSLQSVIMLGLTGIDYLQSWLRGVKILL